VRANLDELERGFQEVDVVLGNVTEDLTVVVDAVRGIQRPEQLRGLAVHASAVAQREIPDLLLVEQLP
jgi:hypothetical protein